MLKTNKWRILAILLILVVGLLWLSPSYLRSEDEVNINNLTLGTLIIGDEISKEDMQDNVVGIIFWGKW
ncbi:MAG: hypothetical protein V1709_05335 [Planctomycetota bacterium]